MNGIARIWSREATWTHGASVLLADAYPGRHVLGLGFGGQPRAGVKPLAAMAGYLDALDAMESPNPGPAQPVRRLLAAYGPKMLELARDRAEGAHTYHVNTAHTTQARQILGADAFLAVEQAVLFETDPARARALAREHLAYYLETPYNIAKFRLLDTPTTTSPAAAATGSWTTWCSGATRRRSWASCTGTWRRAPIMSRCR